MVIIIRITEKEKLKNYFTGINETAFFKATKGDVTLTIFTRDKKIMASHNLGYGFINSDYYDDRFSYLMSIADANEVEIEEEV